jgi:hypothetical protein
VSRQVRTQAPTGAAEWGDFETATSAGRPSLSLNHALDLCATHLSWRTGALAVLTEERGFFTEVLRRVSRDQGPIVAIANLNDMNDMSVYERLVLASEISCSRFRNVLHRLPSGGLVCALARGPAPFISRRGFDNTLGAVNLPDGRIVRISLESVNARILAVYAIRTVPALMWEAAGAFFAKVGRGDLSDRALARMRERYVSVSRQAQWAALTLTIANVP